MDKVADELNKYLKPKKEELKRLVLNGTNNDGRRHRYSFDKNSDFKEGFKSFLLQLGFFGKDLFDIREDVESEDGPTERVWLREAKDIVDECWHFENEKYDVDVFFGDKKVIVLVRIKSKDERDDLIENLEDEACWISEEEKEKRLRKNKKLMDEKAVVAK